MDEARLETEILVVGAGMAGLAAASLLSGAGRDVLVVDKGRGVGGRLASRRIGPATFDHGAQFVTARTSRFAAALVGWASAGVAVEWFQDSHNAAPRFRGAPTMTALAKHLSSGVSLLLDRRMLALRRRSGGWAAAFESGETVLARAVVLTAPVPQSLALIEAGEVSLPAETLEGLGRIGYEPCLAVLAVPEGPIRLPSPGALALRQGPIAWIADNQMKGVSAVPALTVHASAEFSRDHWHRDRQQVGRELLQAADALLGVRTREFQVHGWLFSKPLFVQASACLVLQRQPPLLLAGDAFGGPSIEGATLSGWAAAEMLAHMDQ